MTPKILTLIATLVGSDCWAQHAGHEVFSPTDKAPEARSVRAGDVSPSSAHHAHSRPKAHTAATQTLLPRTSIPAITAEMRAAAFPKGVGGHVAHDKDWQHFTLAEKFEWRDGHGGGGPVWDVSGWVGGNVDRLWLRTEGAVSDGEVADGDVQLFWGHAVTRWWDTVIGVRHDLAPGSSRTWAALGVQGLAPQWFEVQLTAYASDEGHFAAVLQSDYDLLITNRLILQPRLDLVAYAHDEPTRSVASGFSEARLSLRLRYEVRREFAPYIGMEWERALGDTADLIRAAGGTAADLHVIAGVRLWF